MIRSLRAHTPLVTFAVSLTAICGVALVIVSRLAQLERAELVAGALTLDLTVLVPLLYYVLLVRWRGWPVVTVLPVFVGSVVLAGWLIPQDHHQVLDVVHYGAVVAEIALVLIILRRTFQLVRAYRGQESTRVDVYSGLRESANPLLGSVAGNALAYEVAVFYYFLFGWRRAPEAPGRSFTYHRNIPYVAFAGAVMMAMVIETVALHLLLSLWSSVAAWIVTGISGYAMLWLIGDTHAIRLRPFNVADTMLQIRMGLRWTIDVPLDLIDRIGAPTEGALGRGTPGYVKAVLLGAPNCRVELSTPVDALGPYGLRRRVTTIDLQVDGPDLFTAALKLSCEK